MSTRAFARYVGSDDPAPVSLPGYLAAVPSIVAPGDVFAYDERHRDELDSSDRFEVDVEPDEVPSPNEALTREQLAEKINATREDGDEVSPNLPKPELVALADELDDAIPAPRGDAFTGDNDTEGTPR